MLIETLECVLSLFVTGFPRNLASLLLVFNDRVEIRCLE